MNNFAVLGAGAWGTALAFQLTRANPDSIIYLWGHNPQSQRKLQEQRCHAELFPNNPFPQNLHPVITLDEALHNVAGIIIAVPSHGFSELIQKLTPLCSLSLPILSATKGLDPISGNFLHEVVAKEQNFSILSGPSFATEVVKELPTAITIASTHHEYAQFWQTHLHSALFRVYTSEDMIGVQIGGTVKNIMAIATGVADGLGLGANARAALVTRGLAEIMRFNQALGGKQATLMGLAGIGDLVLTCTDNQSRNRRFGMALGMGKSVSAAQLEVQQVVEGYNAAKLVHNLAKLHQIEMPICDIIYDVLYKELSVQQAIQELLSRAPKEE
jgi:glycerol-3-phosphate dehydrogenase (NAD(P)+)